MEYPVLKTLYYKNPEEYNKERAERPASLAAKHLPLVIHGTTAYYMNCQEMTRMISACYETAKELQELLYNLPAVARGFYKLNCLIDEVMLSNDLEGVRSTRKEIQAIIDADRKARDTKARLEGMVKKYLRLLDAGDHVDLNSCAGVRKLYDELVAGEISKDDLPDGEYFRKGPVSVVTATDKEKHKGIAPPEQNIVQHMEAAISLLNDTDIPPLVRIALFHYFLGYIHPFYDGNGRLSRFISSCLIAKYLDEVTALRLSYAIKERKSQYYDAFDIVNDKKNAGDTTPFILVFLEIILASENSLKDRIAYGIEKYEHFKTNIFLLKSLLEEDELVLLRVLMQNRLFSRSSLNIQTLAKAADMSQGAARKKVQDLMNKLNQRAEEEVVSAKREGRKIIYAVDLDALEEFCAHYDG